MHAGRRFDLGVQRREVRLLEWRQQRGPVLADETVQREEQGLTWHAGVPGVEAQVLPCLDECRIRSDASPVGQVGEVTPEQAQCGHGRPGSERT